jgi:hypothetical protein
MRTAPFKPYPSFSMPCRPAPHVRSPRPSTSAGRSWAGQRRPPGRTPVLAGRPAELVGGGSSPTGAHPALWEGHSVDVPPAPRAGCGRADGGRPGLVLAWFEAFHGRGRRAGRPRAGPGVGRAQTRSTSVLVASRGRRVAVGGRRAARSPPDRAPGCRPTASAGSGRSTRRRSSAGPRHARTRGATRRAERHGVPAPRCALQRLRGAGTTDGRLAETRPSQELLGSGIWPTRPGRRRLYRSTYVASTRAGRRRHPRTSGTPS